MTHNRSNNQGIALGGVIDECFYAISYLAKVYTKTKTEQDKGKRFTASSNLNTSSKRKNRTEEIESNVEKIRRNLNSTPLQPKAITGKLYKKFDLN